MLLKSVNEIILLKGEERNTDYGKRFSVILVDEKEDFSKIQATITQEQYLQLPPERSKVDVTLKIVQQNFRTYVTCESIEPTKSVSTNK